jgi:hypothetical protein
LHQQSGPGLLEQFLDEESVTVVVFDQQNPRLFRAIRHRLPL